MTLQQNQIISMHINTADDSDSSSDDVFLELANAWGYVKKWYQFRNRPGSDSKKEGKVVFSRSKSRITKEPDAIRTCFQDMPVGVQIKIFSYLDVYSLSRAATVCRQWYNIANDELLWESKLTRDVQKWQVIDHLSHPDLYRETMADLTAKEIYLHCCPECRQKRNQSTFKFNIPKMSFFLGFSIPRVVMFGPGLESETSGIVKKIFSGPNSPFMVKGMFPGQFDGIGSGVILQYDGGQMNLITLYAASRHEREHNAANGVRRNKFIVERDDADAEEGVLDDDDGPITVTQPVKDLCTTVDAFIYVVDSTLGANRVTVGMDELNAVVNNRWLKLKAPLLVLSCVTEASIEQHSSIHVSDELGLRELNRPWQVRACHVNNLYGLLPGVKWLLHEVMKS